MLTPSVNVVQSSFPEEQQGEVSGLSRSASNLGSSFGTAIAGTILVPGLTTGTQAAAVDALVVTGLGGTPPRRTGPTPVHVPHSTAQHRSRTCSRIACVRLIPRGWWSRLELVGEVATHRRALFSPVSGTGEVDAPAAGSLRLRRAPTLDGDAVVPM